MFIRIIRLLFRSTRSTRTVSTQRRKQRPPVLRVVREHRPEPGQILKGRCWVIDGDTIIIDKIRIRLFGIDAPELNHPYGNNSKFALVNLCKGKVITAVIQDDTSYERLIAKCYLPDGTDLSAALVKQGLAIDWAKFSGGAYRHLEPADARKKMWRADAKQKGRLYD